jgi:hypothetical protein
MIQARHDGQYAIASRNSLAVPTDPGLLLTSAAAVLTDAAAVVRASHRLRAREADYPDGSGQHGKRQRRENDDPLHVSLPSENDGAIKACAYFSQSTN